MLRTGLGTHRRAMMLSVALTLGGYAAACQPSLEGDHHGVPSELTEGRATPTDPLRVIEDHPQRLIIEVKAPEPRLTPVILGGESYARVDLPGFEVSQARGAPALPMLHRLIAIPAGKKVTLRVIEESAPRTIPLTQPVAFNDRAEVHGGTPVFIERDASAYSVVYGDQAAALDAPSYAGPQQVAWLRIAPLRYDAPRGLLTLREALKIVIEFEHDATKSAVPTTALSETVDVTRALVLNPGAVVSHPALAAKTRIDLVIAHSSYHETLAPYLAAKREHGRVVHEHYVDRVTTQQVSTIIRDAYNAAEAPTHTLLVGSIDQIPSFRANGIWTDLNYTFLDRGTLPDLSVARIPAQTPEELSAYLAKATARLATTDGRDGFLLTAGRDTRLGCPANVDRLGNILMQHRASLEVTKLYRSTGASQTQIIDGYNADPNVIIYDGHGDHTGMIEIPLQIAHLNRLSNGRYPIILDIACLNAHWPSNGAARRNFAESILLMPEHGAAGIMAAGGNSGGHTFFQRIVTHMVRGREGHLDGMADPVIDEIGQIVLAAKIESSYSDNYMFNYYGDPALPVFD